MSFDVFLTTDAVRDIEELYQYIANHDTPGKAQSVLTKIEKTFKSLSKKPERGAYPKELLALGIREYREVFFKPYRLIYRIIEKIVYILLIVDGRRDMQSLLQRRLLEK
jgi:toxin ParE1/3/4